jgi:hypothetical protein
MERRATEATSSRHPARTLKGRLLAVGASLWRGQLPMIGACAVVATGLGVVAITTAAPVAPEQTQWLGSLDDGPVRRTSADLLGASAAVQALGEQQMRLAERQRDIELRLAAAVELAAIKPEEPVRDGEVQGLRLVAAALLLRQEAQSARPYRPALERFTTAVSQIDGASVETGLARVLERIAALQPYADAGVVSPRDLRRSFVPLTALVERAVPSSWWDSALILIGWRDDPLQPLQQARDALMVDDLDAAVGALATLQGDAALVAEDWLGLARARLAADVMVDELYSLALVVGSSPVGGPALASGSRATPARRPLEAAPWQAARTSISLGSMAR